MTYKEFYIKNEEIKNYLQHSNGTFSILLINKVKGNQIQVGEWVVTNQKLDHYAPKTYPISEVVTKVLTQKAFIRNLSKISYWNGFETEKDKKKAKVVKPNSPVYLVTVYIKTKNELKEWAGVFYNKTQIQTEIENLAIQYKESALTYNITTVTGEGGFVFNHTIQNG